MNHREQCERPLQRVTLTVLSLVRGLLAPDVIRPSGTLFRL